MHKLQATQAGVLCSWCCFGQCFHLGRCFHLGHVVAFKVVAWLLSKRPCSLRRTTHHSRPSFSDSDSVGSGDCSGKVWKGKGTSLKPLVNHPINTSRIRPQGLHSVLRACRRRRRLFEASAKMEWSTGGRPRIASLRPLVFDLPGQ